MAEFWLTFAIAGVLIVIALWWALIKQVKGQQRRGHWRRRR